MYYIEALWIFHNYNCNTNTVAICNFFCFTEYFTLSLESNFSDSLLPHIHNDVNKYHYYHYRFQVCGQKRIVIMSIFSVTVCRGCVTIYNCFSLRGKMAKINKVVPKQEYKKPKYAPLKTVKRATNHLRTSWHVQARLFFEKSTLHGVRYIAESGRPFIEKYVQN